MRGTSSNLKQKHRKKWHRSFGLVRPLFLLFRPLLEIRLSGAIISPSLHQKKITTALPAKGIRIGTKLAQFFFQAGIQRTVHRLRISKKWARAFRVGVINSSSIEGLINRNHFPICYVTGDNTAPSEWNTKPVHSPAPKQNSLMLRLFRDS